MESRDQILSSSAEVFAEKGFEGARVDEIARRANVNKALIYYYFKSKEELLSSLFQEISDMAGSFMEADEVSRIELDTPPEAIAPMLDKVISALIRKQNIVRIIVMESAKKSPINKQVFNMMQNILDYMLQKGRPVREGWKVPENMESMIAVTEFFTSIMPLLNYVVYHDAWVEHFQISETELRSQFIEALIGTHIEYSFRVFRKLRDHQ